MIYKDHTIKQVADTFVVLGYEDWPDFDWLEDVYNFIDTGWRGEMGGYFVHKNFWEVKYDAEVLDIFGFQKKINAPLEELYDIVINFVRDVARHFRSASYQPMKWVYKQEGWYQSGPWDLIRVYDPIGWRNRYRIYSNGQYFCELDMKDGLEYIVNQYVPKLLTMECGAEFNGFVTKEGRRSWVRAICAIN